MTDITTATETVRHQLDWLHGQRAPIFEAQGATIDTSRALAALTTIETELHNLKAAYAVADELETELTRLRAQLASSGRYNYDMSERDCGHDERDPDGCVRCDDGQRMRDADRESERLARQSAAFTADGVVTALRAERDEAVAALRDMSYFLASGGHVAAGLRREQERLLAVIARLSTPKETTDEFGPLCPTCGAEDPWTPAVPRSPKSVNICRHCGMVEPVLSTPKEPETP